MSSEQQEKSTPTMDWQQVVLNGGPPCFFIEDRKFCGRAERWQGHGVRDFHDFVSLESLLAEKQEEIEKLSARVAVLEDVLRDAAFTYHMTHESLRFYPDCDKPTCIKARGMLPEKVIIELMEE